MSEPDPKLVEAIQRQTDPFLHEPPYARTFYEAMGRMALIWTRLEKALDDLLLAIVVIAGNDIEPQPIYMAISRKLKLAISIFNKVPSLLPYHGKMITLAGNVRKNSNDRNAIMHASWVGFDDGPPTKMQLQLLNLSEIGHVTIKDISVSIDTIQKMARNFFLCTAKIHALSIDVSEILKTIREREGAPYHPLPPS